MIAAGVNAKALSTYMGHSSITVTLDRYGRLSRLSPATQTSGPVEDEWLRDNLVAIAQLAESLDRGSFELAMRIVPIDWWTAQLPDRPSTAENLPT
jgi:hypothetical protein